MKWVIGLAALVLAPQPARAEPVGEFVEIKEGQPVAIADNKAYFLLRISRPNGATKIEPIFLRVPSEQELKDYFAAREAAYRELEPDLLEARAEMLRKKEEAEARGKTFKGVIPPEPTLDAFDFVWSEKSNTENIQFNSPFMKSGDDTLYVVEVPAGEYVLYGAAIGGSFDAHLHLCFCLGTVGFNAKAGEITDLGFFLGDSARWKSPIPELAAESDFGPSSDTVITLLTGTVRPVRSGDLVPPQLAGMLIKAADYHAVGRYFHPAAFGVNRLVPVPGVLAYDRGKVIDVKSGLVMPDHFEGLDPL